jgi:hypothetical protein
VSRLFGIEEAAQSSDRWFTPAWIFDGMGVDFDLDVAAPTAGPLHVPCTAWYSETDDGLSSRWYGVVWCNPPYSAPTRRLLCVDGLERLADRLVELEGV